MRIQKGRKLRPRRTMLYGVHGVGKTTWAADAPDVLFLNFEDGLDDIEADSTERITDFKRLMEWMHTLYGQQHEYQCLAFDTVDWLEAIIHKQVAKDAGKDSIADIGYGAGYKAALAYWDRLLIPLGMLRDDKNMGIIFLAHTEIKRFDSPESESYDRYQPALHPLASALLQEWCDEVLFASYRVYTKKEDQGFNKERSIAVGNSERYLRCQETAAVNAKNRLRMPPEIPFTWADYANFFPGKVAGNTTDEATTTTTESA